MDHYSRWYIMDHSYTKVAIDASFILGFIFELHLVVAEYFCGIISFTHLYPHSFSQILIHTFTYFHPRSLCPITYCHPVMIRFAISFLKIKFNRLDRFKFNHFIHYM